MRLKQDLPCLRQRRLAVPVVLHPCEIDHELAVEINRRPLADLHDAELVPLAERLVSEHERIATRSIGRVVEEPARAQVRLARGILGVELLVPVPDLHLRRVAKVDAAIGLRHCLVLDQEFDVAVVLVGREVRAVAVVHQFAVLDAPVLLRVGVPLVDLLGTLVRGELREVGRAIRPSRGWPSRASRRGPCPLKSGANPAGGSAARRGETTSAARLRWRNA